MSLVSAPELHESLGEVRLFDIRWDLSDPTGGRKRYLDGHTPRAVFVDLESDLTGTDGPGRHPLPDPDDFTRTLGRLGVGAHDDVVVYDDAGGSVAARMWWMLEAIGHRGEVRVLDGGWQAWAGSGYEQSSDEVAPVAAPYPSPAHGFRGVIDRAGVAERGRHVLLDARSPERYRGESEPVDPRAGHIPGAINAPWQINLRSDGTFEDPATLRKRYESLGADRRPVIVSCGSGVTSCHVVLALELAGLPRPLLYPGSFSDWSRSDLPVVEGAHPA